MKSRAILLALGDDRVGVADDLATSLADRKIDIEHSRMTALGGQFALIVQLLGERSHLSTLEDELVTLAKGLGFQLRMEPVRPARPVRLPPELSLEVVSRGPSGFHAVTALLKRRGINIEDLETDAHPDSWTSAITFHMRARLTVPPSYSVDHLTEDLRELEHGRRLEVTVKSIAQVDQDPIDTLRGGRVLPAPPNDGVG